MDKFIVNGKNVEVLYKTDYFGRYLYILQIDGKVTQVYRSSGFSGTGHKGKFLPFLGLANRQTLSQTLGYIFKEMRYNGSFISHGKRVSWSVEIEDFLEQLELFLTDESADIPDDITHSQMAKHIHKVTSEMKHIMNQNELFDWATLETQPKTRDQLEDLLGWI